MKKLIISFLVIVLVLSCIVPGIAEEDSEQYKLFAQTLRFDEDRLDTLNEMISLDPLSSWAGWAKLEIGKLLVKESKFSEAENVILEVINSFGSLSDPTGGITVFPKGYIDIKEENLIATLSEKVPVLLESTARLTLAKLYLEMGKEQDANLQLQILIDDGTLQLLSHELELLEESMPADVWYPQQTALRMRFDLRLGDETQKNEVREIAELIELYGNPRDIAYVQIALSNVMQRKQKLTH